MKNHVATLLALLVLSNMPSESRADPCSDLTGKWIVYRSLLDGQQDVGKFSKNDPILLGSILQVDRSTMKWEWKDPQNVVDEECIFPKFEEDKGYITARCSNIAHFGEGLDGKIFMISKENIRFKWYEGVILFLKRL